MTAPARLTLEVIVSSVEDAIAAARGGADRLEVVRDLRRAGLTPPLDLVRRIQDAVALPLRVMVRESDGFACASDDERRALIDAAAVMDDLRVDGLVIGWTRGERIDEETLALVLRAAPSLRATFHRAFDAVPDPKSALRVLKRHPQIDHVLTGGGGGDWALRCARLTRCAAWAAPEITVLPGGDVNVEALRVLVACGALTEAHVGRAARTGYSVDGAVSAEAVSELRRAASSPLRR